MTDRIQTSRRLQRGLAIFVSLLLSLPVLPAYLELARLGWPRLGIDYGMYIDAAERWLIGEAFYLSHQLAGPYQVAHLDVLYPPPVLALLVPFTILPAMLWWLIPLSRDRCRRRPPSSTTDRLAIHRPLHRISADRAEGPDGQSRHVGRRRRSPGDDLGMARRWCTHEAHPRTVCAVRGLEALVVGRPCPCHRPRGLVRAHVAGLPDGYPERPAANRAPVLRPGGAADGRPDPGFPGFFATRSKAA
jgi:hypothetical protein